LDLELELKHGEKRFKHTNLRSFFSFFSKHKQSEENVMK
jgi:hypothetical protein